jgi:hypothetical protein
MKYQAPVGLTAISCAGETFAPDENGGFEAAEGLVAELAAHGCVPAGDAVPTEAEKAGDSHPRARARARAEKAN